MIIQATAWEECGTTNRYIPDNDRFIEEASYGTSNGETNRITIPSFGADGYQGFYGLFHFNKPINFFFRYLCILHTFAFQIPDQPSFYFNKSLAILVLLKMTTANHGSQRLYNVCGDRLL